MLACIEAARGHGAADRRPHSRGKQDRQPSKSPRSAGGVCRRKQYPPRADGRCSFICPRNSCVKDGRACVDTIGDCACTEGFTTDLKRNICVIDTSECIQTPPKGSAGCHFKCPPYSCIKSGHGCVDGIEDCACVGGYIMDAATGRCISSTAIPQNRPLRLAVEPSTLGISNDAQEEVEIEPVPYREGLSVVLGSNEVARAQTGNAQLAPEPGTAMLFIGPDHGQFTQSLMVDQDLDVARRDPQDEVSATLGELLLFGTQLSIVLAFIRGLMHLYSTYKPLYVDRKPHSNSSSQPFYMGNSSLRDSCGGGATSRQHLAPHSSPMSLHEI